MEVITRVRVINRPEKPGLHVHTPMPTSHIPALLQSSKQLSMTGADMILEGC